MCVCESFWYERAWDQDCTYSSAVCFLVKAMASTVRQVRLAPVVQKRQAAQIQSLIAEQLTDSITLRNPSRTLYPRDYLARWLQQQIIEINLGFRSSSTQPKELELIHHSCQVWPVTDSSGVMPDPVLSVPTIKRGVHSRSHLSAGGIVPRWMLSTFTLSI